MNKETTSQKLRRYLDASVGSHNRIAKESGVAQATLSRIYLNKGTTSLDTAEKLVAWFDADAAKKSTLGLTHTKRVRVQRTGSAAASAVA